MNINDLCNMLDIPDEVKMTLLECEKHIDFNSLEQELEQMKQPLYWERALERLKEVLGFDEDGMKILTCQLKCVCDTYSKYKELGISEDIFVSTMKFFTRFLNEHKDRHGSYCYVWAWWAVRQISMMEFRIGVLEYEMRMENEKRMIDIHIPADADMDIIKLRDSYLKAIDFFKTYYPEYMGVDFVCSSWLLAPSLKKVLPVDSRIIHFQKSFMVDRMDEDSLGYMDWIYGCRDIPLEELPEYTSLQRNLKPHLLNGGKIEWASGRLIANPFCVE